MRYNEDMTIGKGLEDFINAKELYLVVCIDRDVHNPWGHEVITLSPKDVEFRYDKDGSLMLIKTNLGLNIWKKVLFNDLREAQIFRTQKGCEALDYATRKLQNEYRDWRKNNKEFMDDVEVSALMDSVIAVDKEKK